MVNGQNDLNSKTLSRHTAQSFYDRVGGIYHWFSSFEAGAKNHAVESLSLAPGLRLLNVGLGIGREQLEFQARLSPGGFSIGIDISPKMLQIAATTSPGSLCRADGSDLPFPNGLFDRLYCAYVLDLVSIGDIPIWFTGFRRVLKPGGLLVNLSLTEGVDKPSRLLVNLWKSTYALNPSLCGGCRPLTLSKMIYDAGFEQVDRSVIVQMGVPSELIVAS